MNKEIVVSASFKELNWLSQLNDIKKTVYRKGTEIQNSDEIKIDINKGVAEHTYFYHLYHNYDNLSDITFFVQDFPFDHWGKIIEVINNNNWKEKCDLNIKDGFFSFNNNALGASWHLFDSEHFIGSKILFCNSDGSPHYSFTDNYSVDMIWEMLFENDKLNRYEFIPGTHFGVTKEHVKIRNKDFYKQIMDLLITSPNLPHIIERLNCYIFDERFKSKI